MSPGRLGHRANRAAVAAFLVAALAVGYVLGVQSTQVDDGDLLVGRRQAYDRQQCLVDYLSLPETRLEVAGGGADLVTLCAAVQQLVRPDDPAPDVGPPPP